MLPPTAPLESDEIDIDTSTLDEPIDSTLVAGQPLGGPYAAFTTQSGRVLEFHVPGAIRCFIKGPSPATACAFIVRNPDGSIEHSGSLGLDAYL
jgi:hypothetical protein